MIKTGEGQKKSSRRVVVFWDICFRLFRLEGTKVKTSMCVAIGSSLEIRSFLVFSTRASLSDRKDAVSLSDFC